MANTPNLDLKRMEGNPKSTNFNHKEYYENNFEKVDAAVGAPPSTLTTEAKTLVPAIIELQSEKVDKVEGKGLSTNDFDNTYKQKIDIDIPAQLAETGNRIDNIIATPIELPEIYVDEIHDARQGKGSIGANITEVKTSLAQNQTQLDLMQLYKGGTKLIAHRGAEMIAPENTSVAFEKAGEIGFWGTETDIQWTSDGVAIIHHDRDIATMTNGAGNIDTLTYAQVMTYNVDTGIGISPYASLKLCTFEEYLKINKKYGMHCLIEIKASYPVSDANIDSFLALISKYRMEKRCIIMSGSTVMLDRFRARAKDIVLALYVEDAHTPENLQWMITNSPCIVGCNFNIALMTDAVINNYHDNQIPVAVATPAVPDNAYYWKRKNVDFIISKVFIESEV